MHLVDNYLNVKLTCISLSEAVCKKRKYSLSEIEFILLNKDLSWNLINKKIEWKSSLNQSANFFNIN